MCVNIYLKRAFPVQRAIKYNTANRCFFYTALLHVLFEVEREEGQQTKVLYLVFRLAIRVKRIFNPENTAVYINATLYKFSVNGD